MNKIVLNKPLLLNKRYIVYLDSENKFSFSNKKEAHAFIVYIAKEIEQATLFITEEFNSLEEFNRLYYLADKDYKFKFLISNSVDFLNNRLNWMQSHEGSPNHDTILFHAVAACIEELKTAFGIMQKKAACRKDTISKRRCALKAHILDIYYEKLLSIGIKPSQISLQIKKTRQR